MIKKRACLEFMDKVENKAITSVKEKFAEKVKAEELKALEPYMQEIKKAQNLTNDLHVLSQSLYMNLHDDKAVSLCDEWRNLASEISDFTGGNTLLGRVLEHSTFHGGSVQKIIDKRDKELDEVKAEYLKVRTVCQNKSNGAQAAEYLKGIGFDISSLEKAENTALLPQLNKKYLFVCGENK